MLGDPVMPVTLALLALAVALWSALESRRAAARARAAMATLVEVVGLMETLTEEGREPVIGVSSRPEPAAGWQGVPAMPLPEAPPVAGTRARIAGLASSGATVTEICRALSVSTREVALGLALDGQGRSAAR